MEIKSKVVRHNVGGIIKPDLGHDKYEDWHEDDTQRDPTPANKRRTEMFKETKPKAGPTLAIECKELGIEKGPLKL